MISWRVARQGMQTSSSSFRLIRKRCQQFPSSNLNDDRVRYFCIAVTSRIFFFLHLPSHTHPSFPMKNANQEAQP